MTRTEEIAVAKRAANIKVQGESKYYWYLEDTVEKLKIEQARLSQIVKRATAQAIDMNRTYHEPDTFSRFSMNQPGLQENFINHQYVIPITFSALHLQRADIGVLLEDASRYVRRELHKLLDSSAYRANSPI